jgi:hypothetical protein
MLRGSVTALATNWNRFVSSHLPRGWFYFFGFIFLGRKIPAQQQRTCSYHSLEKFLTLSLGLGSLVKEAISTELLSLDRSKIESIFKEIQAIRSKMPSKESARLT